MFGSRVLLHAGEEEVRPAVVLVGGGASAVGYGVADDEERTHFWCGPGFDTRDEVPVGYGLLGGVGDGEAGGGDGVARLKPTCCSRARVAGDAVGLLAVGKVHCHCDDLLRIDFKIDRVRHGQGAVGNADAILTTKGHLLDSLGLDLVDSGCLVQG